MAELKKGTYGNYYVGSLSSAQKEANVLYIYKYLTTKADPKWTLNAVAGLCGNIESECGFNPGAEEAGGSGFGLIQWTPGTGHVSWWAEHKSEYPEFSGADYKSIDAQLAHIAWEAKNGASWMQNASWGTINYKDTIPRFQDFAVSTLDAYFLACAYAWCRERSGVVQWGFHTKNHSDRFCMPGYSRPEIGCYTCYANKYGTTAADKQAEVNRQALRDTRGGQANKWRKFIIEANFTPRLDDTDTSVLTSPYWKSSLNGRGGLNYNTAIEDWPNAQNGWTATDKQNIKGTYTTLPNCTSWAWGRAYEIMGEAPPRFTGDAGNWWNSYDALNTNNALVNKGYYKSSTPSLGAIACWQDPDNPTSMGHVAIVEKIYDNGNISFSESGYQTWVWRPSYFNVQDNKNPNVAYSSKYTFVGYISLPSFGGGLPTIDSFEFIEARTEEADFQISITENGGSISRSYYTLDTGVTGNLNLTGGDNTFTISNLVPNTDYTISVTLEVNGGSVTSNTVSFKTKQDYPDGVKNIKIQSVSKNLETSSFKVNVEAPDRWGYWQRIGNEYGYKVFIIEDSKLISNYNDTSRSNNFYITPNSKNVKHGKNFQIGISTWVTDNDDIKVFALPGEEFPVGSNSVLLKDISEMSDTWFIISNSKINRVQPYFKKTKTSKPKPLNVYKL